MYCSVKKNTSKRVSFSEELVYLSPHGGEESDELAEETKELSDQAKKEGEVDQPIGLFAFYFTFYFQISNKFVEIKEGVFLKKYHKLDEQEGDQSQTETSEEKVIHSTMRTTTTQHNTMVCVVLLWCVVLYCVLCCVVLCCVVLCCVVLFDINVTLSQLQKREELFPLRRHHEHTTC